MKSSRTAADGDGVSLFPFLAVLLCTLGALVLLLCIMARQARLAAAAHEDLLSDPTPRETLQQEIDSARWRNDLLRESRDKTAHQLEEQRLALSHVEDHARRLRDQLEEIEKANQEFGKLAATDATERERLRAQLDETEKLLASTRAEVEAKRNSVDARPVAYAVVPYEGTNGTNRRPIYIECREDAIVLQPEGVELTELDFAVPAGADNPLASALRAAREYHVRYGDTPGANGGEPYPLLLVRPGGISAYYVAREAIKSWGPDFGYELVGEEWQLEFPPRDESLAKTLDRAVVEARRRQVALARAAPRHAARGERPSFGPPPEEDEWLSEHGGRPGGRNGSTAEGIRGGRGFVSPRSSEREDLARLYGGQTGGNTQLPGNATRGGLVQSGGLAGSGSLGAGHGTNFGAPKSGSPFERAGDDASGGTAAHGNAQDGTVSTSPGTNGTSETTQSVDGDVSTVAKSNAVAPHGATANGTPTRGTPANGAASNGTSASRASAAGTSQGGGAESASSQSVESLAGQRGSNWALPSSAKGSVGITRPIAVECRAERLTLFEGIASPRTLAVIPLGPNSADSVDELVSDIWTHIETWGPAGRGMYWKPVLVMHVVPGGSARYVEFESLLEGSGLDIVRKETSSATVELPAGVGRR